MNSVKHFFYIDNLSLIMVALILFVGSVVISFSLRYHKGDRKRGAFYFNLLAMLVSSIFLVCADHLLLFYAAWVFSNFFLTQLMLHKNEWVAAKESSRLALKNFGLGALFLGLAFGCLYYITGRSTIQSLYIQNIEDSWLFASILLLLLAAMTQSALWPFHSWLISSLNSPTPVSAIMHAGLVNAGGFLLVRFAPLYLSQEFILSLMFLLGILTALLGTLCKLMQSDIKRMLAWSTMGQMGFMVAQCGLGLFPAAISHLCLHGLFKAYLFLASGSVAQEKRLDLDYPPKIKDFLLSLGGGFICAYSFYLISSQPISVNDTTSFLILLAFVAGTQFALPLIRNGSSMKMPLIFCATAMLGGVYGMTFLIFESLLSPLSILEPQSLNLLHLLALLILISTWFIMVFWRGEWVSKNSSNWVLALYVRMLNFSQPHPKTVTAHRNSYEF